MRIFFGIQTPEPILGALHNAQQDLLDLFGPDTLRLEHLENSHVTLAFLGDVDEANVSSLIESAGKRIEASGIRPFELRITDVDVNAKRKARVVWANVEPIEQCRTLHQEIRAVAEEHQIEIEDRLFRPHITLGRFRYAVDVRQTSLPKLESISATVAEVVLIESELGIGPPKHTVIARFPL